MELLSPSDIPVDLAEIKYESTGVRFEGKAYTVENRSRNGLVMLGTAWTFSGGDADNPRTRTVIHVADSWETAGNLVPAGGSAAVSASFDVFGSPIRTVTVAVIYAEFENGDRLGAASDCMYRQIFLPQRAKILKAYAAILAKSKSGVSKEEVDKFVDRQPGLTWLRLARAQDGFEYMLEQVARRRFLESSAPVTPR